MFLGLSQIKDALENLKAIHPFYGLTFLACKRERLPIGQAIPFQISVHETALLDQYYRPQITSQYYYQVFRTSVKENRWVRGQKYASSTLQSTRTRSDFRNAF